MDNGHGASGADRADLLAENPILTGLHRCVIQAARINGDFIPMSDSFGRTVRTLLWRELCRCGRGLEDVIAPTPEIAGGAKNRARRGGEGDTEGGQDGGWDQELEM